MATVGALDTPPGSDPDRASFTTALEAARDQLTAARGICAGSPQTCPPSLAALLEQRHALGGEKPWPQRLAVRAAAGDPGGIAHERNAILDRAAFAYHDEMAAMGALAGTETHMVDVLDQLDLTGVVTPMPSLSAAGRR